MFVPCVLFFYTGTLVKLRKACMMCKDWYIIGSHGQNEMQRLNKCISTSPASYMLQDFYSFYRRLLIFLSFYLCIRHLEHLGQLTSCSDQCPGPYWNLEGEALKVYNSLPLQVRCALDHLKHTCFLQHSVPVRQNLSGSFYYLFQYFALLNAYCILFGLLYFCWTVNKTWHILFNYYNFFVVHM